MTISSTFQEFCKSLNRIQNSEEALAKVRNLPFDMLRVNGLRLKLFSFSVRGEPFDSPFALRFSKGERFAQDKLVEPQKNTFARGSRV